jgi:hypothetical protein
MFGRPGIGAAKGALLSKTIKVSEAVERIPDGASLMIEPVPTMRLSP